MSATSVKVTLSHAGSATWRVGKQGALPSAGPGVRCVDTAFPELALGTRARGCVRGWSRRHRRRSRRKCPGARRPPPRGPQAHPAAGCGGRWGGVDGRWHKRATPAAGTPRRGRQDTAAALAGRAPSGDGGQRGLDARTRPALLPGGPARAEVARVRWRHSRGQPPRRPQKATRLGLVATGAVHGAVWWWKALDRPHGRLLTRAQDRASGSGGGRQSYVTLPLTASICGAPAVMNLS